jgi:hypothetical protein
MATNDKSVWQVAAAKRFPYSAQNIRGDGKYTCISKCFRRWRVLLYPTEEARAVKEREWNDRGCGPDCRSDHFTFTLSL